MRLAGKAGIVVGAGQSPGKTVGTGRAAALVFAREGAKVMLADRDLASAQETAAMITDAGGVAECVRADWTDAADCQAMARACLEAWGRIDFLHNNVGIGAGDSDPLRRDRGGARPDPHRQPQGLRALMSGGAAGDARSGGWLDREHLIDRRSRGCDPADRVQALEGRDQRPRPIPRDRQRRRTASASTRSCPACSTRRWRSTRAPRTAASRVSKSSLGAPRRCRSGRRWGRPGTSRTRACSSTPTRRSSSLAPCSPSTAASSLASAGRERPTKSRRNHD